MKLTKLIEANSNQRLIDDLLNGISSLEKAKEDFTNYLSTIQRKDSAEDLTSLDDFEMGVDAAVEKDDIVAAIETLNALILKLKSSGAERYIPLKNVEKHLDKNKYVKV